MKFRLSTLEPLRVRVRRGQLIVGLGFLAYVLGSLCSAFLLSALSSLLADIPWIWLTLLLGGVLSQLWALLFLPLFCFVAGRAFNVRPLSTPLGMLGTGCFFVLMLGFVTEGLEGLAQLPFLWWAARILCWAAAVWLGRAALLRAQVMSARADERARATAKENACQYDELLRESERLAARHEAREAQRTTPPVTRTEREDA